jgi:nicotinate-nucleotide adenylyltransferase
MERVGKTYTIDTIKQLREVLGEDKKFYFVMGADAMLLIDTWKNSSELLKICSFIAVTRPGYDTREFISFVDDLKKRQECDIKIMEIPAVDISSSEIRECVSKGESIKGFVPEKVEKYIIENGLYK